MWSTVQFLLLSTVLFITYNHKTINNLGVPYRVWHRATISNLPREEIMEKVLQEAQMKYKYELFTHEECLTVNRIETCAFEELRKSKRSLILFNHVGAADFVVTMQIMDMVERLNQLRWVTLKMFDVSLKDIKLFRDAGLPRNWQNIAPARKLLDKLDALLLTQKSNEDGQIIKEYAEKHKSDENLAIIVFPEGDLLNKENYLRCKSVMEKHIQHIFRNMCVPRVLAVEKLLEAFPDIDVFDVTIKYFDERGSGDAINSDYIGDRYSVVNVAVHAQHPDSIFASIRKLETPNGDIKGWLNKLWISKEKILDRMRDPQVDYSNESTK